VQLAVRASNELNVSLPLPSTHHIRSSIEACFKCNIQSLIKLQDKTVKLIISTTHTSSEKSFQQLNILYLLKLYTLSAGKFMHSYCNNLLPHHFNVHFNPINSIHSYSTRLSTSYKLFLPRVN